MEQLSLGRLISSQNLGSAARKVYEKTKNRKQFSVALTACKHLVSFSFWERFFDGHLIGQTVSRHNVFQEFGKLAIRLYDQGPEHRDIWKRSGGDNSKLRVIGSREESWYHAISLLEHGGGGNDLSIKKMAKEMLEDFPNHTELKEFKNYFK